jgi:hypothetical protein
VIKAGILTAMTSMTNALISNTLGTGMTNEDGSFDWEGFLYPKVDRVLGKDKEGHPKRIKPPFWVTTEIGGWLHDVHDNDRMGAPFNMIMGTGQFFLGKMQPGLATAYDLLKNTDYFGGQIAQPGDQRKSSIQNTLDQTWERTLHALNSVKPFAFQAFAKNRDPMIW